MLLSVQFHRGEKFNRHHSMWERHLSTRVSFVFHYSQRILCKRIKNHTVKNGKHYCEQHHQQIYSYIKRWQCTMLTIRPNGLDKDSLYITWLSFNFHSTQLQINTCHSCQIQRKPSTQRKHKLVSLRMCIVMKFNQRDRSTRA